MTPLHSEILRKTKQKKLYIPSFKLFMTAKWHQKPPPFSVFYTKVFEHVSKAFREKECYLRFEKLF